MLGFNFNYKFYYCIIVDRGSMELLIGILLDVFGFMSSNIGSGIDEEGGLWVCLIFDVIDNFIRYDVFFDNYVFVIGVGVSLGGGVFDVI